MGDLFLYFPLAKCFWNGTQSNASILGDLKKLGNEGEKTRLNCWENDKNNFLPTDQSTKKWEKWEQGSTNQLPDPCYWSYKLTIRKEVIRYAFKVLKCSHWTLKQNFRTYGIAGGFGLIGKSLVNGKHWGQYLFWAASALAFMTLDVHWKTKGENINHGFTQDNGACPKCFPLLISMNLYDTYGGALVQWMIRWNGTTNEAAESLVYLSSQAAASAALYSGDGSNLRAPPEKPTGFPCVSSKRREEMWANQRFERSVCYGQWNNINDFEQHEETLRGKPNLLTLQCIFGFILEANHLRLAHIWTKWFRKIWPDMS